MERQAKGNLLIFIEELKSSVVSEEKLVCERIKKDSFYSIYDVISSIRDYVESTKYLVFDRVVYSTYRQAINIKEFNEMRDNYEDKLKMKQMEIDNLKKEIEHLKSLRNNLKPKEKQIKDSDIQYIKELRSNGLSYREISKETSWSKATICRVLNGMYD